MLELMLIYIIVSGGIAVIYVLIDKMYGPIKNMSKKMFKKNRVFPKNENE